MFPGDERRRRRACGRGAANGAAVTRVRAFRPDIEIGGAGRAGAARLRDRRGRREPQPRPRAREGTDRRGRGRRCRRREVPDLHRRGPLLDEDAALRVPRRRPEPARAARRDRASARVAVRARRARAVSRRSRSSPRRSTDDAVDGLAALGVPAMKIASFELVDLQLIRHAAATGVPVILSTGMATYGEIEDALGAVESAGNDQVALLRCASLYPSPPEIMNLRAMATMRAAFGVPVGPLGSHDRDLDSRGGRCARGRADREALHPRPLAGRARPSVRARARRASRDGSSRARRRGGARQRPAGGAVGRRVRGDVPAGTTERRGGGRHSGGHR